MSSSSMLYCTSDIVATLLETAITVFRLCKFVTGLSVKESLAITNSKKDAWRKLSWF
jgi:hypothetical protein